MARDDDEDSSPRKPLPALNVSERPTRNRKRNSRFFNDYEDTSWGHRSPRKRTQPVVSASSHKATSSTTGIATSSSLRSTREIKQEKSTSSDIVSTIVLPKQISTPSTSTLSAARTTGSTISATSSSTSAASQESHKYRLRDKPSGPLPPAGLVGRTKQRLGVVRSVGFDRAAATHTTTRLRNFLDLPRARKWVMYEFFYSNIDDCLFNRENEFVSYLKQSFPLLRTRQLTRTEWSRIRRLMGKPRRCSAAFFSEELRALHEKRELVRQLQQRLVDRLELVEHLPAEIPLSLVIGTRVMAYLHERDGIFMGTIDAVDAQGATYRVAFERPELGTVTCPDFEVLSLQRVERMPIEYFIQRPRVMQPPRALYPPTLLKTEDGATGDPLLSSSSALSSLDTAAAAAAAAGRYGTAFPMSFLTLMVRFARVLSDKKRKIDRLREMNAFVERSVLNRDAISAPFRRRYAVLLLDLTEINHDLNYCVESIHKLCEQIQPDYQEQHSMLSHPTAVRARSTEQARAIVAAANGGNTSGGITNDYSNGSGIVDAVSQRGPLVTDMGHLELIERLVVVLLQIKAATERKHATYELRSLQDAIRDVQSKISSQSQAIYENEVEVHLLHVQQLLTKKAKQNLKAKMAATGAPDEITAGGNSKK